MIKLSMSTNAFKRHTIEEAISVIAGIGYGGIEIMADAPHVVPADAGQDRLEDIRCAIEAAGLAAANVNAFTMFARGDTYHPSWIEPSPALRRERLRHTEASLHLAAAIGSPYISTEPGGPADGFDDAHRCGSEPAAAVALFEEGLRAVLPTAREAGVKILIEPEPGLLIERWDQIETFLARFGGEPVGLNFDAGHFYCVGEDPAELILQHGDSIEHVHIEDIAADRVHRHLVPGEGAIDFASIFDALRQVEYDGYVTLELYPYQETAAEVARRGHEFLSQFIF